MISSNISGLGSVPTRAEGAVSTKNAGQDFGSIMSQSLAGKTQSHEDLYTNVSQNTKKPEAAVGTDTGKAQTDTYDTSKDKIHADNTAGAAQTDEVEEKITSDDANQIDSMMEDIKDKIEDEFGVTEEELLAALEALGMQLQDLLKPNNLTELAAQLTGSDGAMSLLTDSTLTQQLKNVMNFVNEQVANTAEALEMTPEELKAMLTQPQESFTDNMAAVTEGAAQEEVVPEVRAEGQSDVQAEQSKQTEQADAAEKTDITLQNVVEEKLAAGQAGSDGAKMDFAKQEQGKAEQTPLANIAANLSQSIGETFQNLVTDTAQVVDTADVISQIMDQVKVNATQQIQSMEVQLNPENLGKLNVTVTIKEGILTAQLAAQNESVKKALENQMSVLKESFSQQGLKVDAVEVTIASHSFEANQNMNQNSSNDQAQSRARRNLNLDSLNGLDSEELTEDEQRALDFMQNENSSVTYTA